MFKRMQAVTAVCKWKKWAVSMRGESLRGRQAFCKGKRLPPLSARSADCADVGAFPR